MNRFVKGVAGVVGLAGCAVMGYKTFESYGLAEDFRAQISEERVVKIGGFTITADKEAADGFGQVVQFVEDLPRGAGNALGFNNDSSKPLSPVDAYLGNAATEFAIFLGAGTLGGAALRSAIRGSH